MRPQPAGEHVGDRGLQAVERAGEVDREHAVPGFDRDVGERLELVEARARHHDPDRTELARGPSRSRRRLRRGRRRRPRRRVRAQPVARRSSAARFAASPSRSSSATWCPAPARRCATARPIPAAAPVTTATRLIVLPCGRCVRPMRVWTIRRIVRKLALEKRERHCHHGRNLVRVSWTPDARGAEGGSQVRIGLMIGAEKGRYRDKVAQLARRRRGGREGGIHARSGCPRSRTTSTRSTAIALMGGATSRVELGTAVMPIQTRHPIAMAQQALSNQAVCEGRFTLGLGPSHHWIVSDMLGLPYERPAASRTRTTSRC